MNDKNKPNGTSRREFLKVFTKKEEEMVKMLTPDGKLVLIPRSAVTKATNKQKASNQHIYEWMKNPSK